MKRVFFFFNHQEKKRKEKKNKSPWRRDQCRVDAMQYQ